MGKRATGLGQGALPRFEVPCYEVVMPGYPSVTYRVKEWLLTAESETGLSSLS